MAGIKHIKRYKYDREKREAETTAAHPGNMRN